MTGRAEAFAELVARHQRTIFALLLGILRQRREAEALTARTFLRGYTYLDRQKSPRPFAPWLNKIAVNLALTRLREVSRGRFAAWSQSRTVNQKCVCC